MTKARTNADNVAGDISGVTAGTGLTGGGTSGTVTLTNDMATTIAAKGDILAGTANDAYSVLSLGSNDQVLTADSSTATGLKWAAAGSADNFQLINSGGTALTGATTITVNVSGKNSLYVRIAGASSVNAASIFTLRLSGDSGSNYNYSSMYLVDASQGATTQYFNLDYSSTATSIPLGRLGNSDTAVLRADVLIQGTNAAGIKPIQLNSDSYGDNTTDRSYTLTGCYFGSSAITSVSIISSTGNFDAGTIYVYGA